MNENRVPFVGWPACGKIVADELSLALDLLLVTIRPTSLLSESRDISTPIYQSTGQLP
jgi:hypothetical protein